MILCFLQVEKILSKSREKTKLRELWVDRWIRIISPSMSINQVYLYTKVSF